MAPVYTTAAAYVDYVPGFVMNVQADLEAILEQAERDIDSIIPGYPFGERIAGRKIDPVTDLDTDQAVALSNAVCAQAQYRIEMGQEFFIRPQYDSVSGPDFTVQGKAPLISPQARREMRGFNFMQFSSRLVI